MQIITSVIEMQKYVRTKRAENKTIGIVPTMGWLHLGHLSLMIEARKNNDIVIASIFVNPLQFGLGEDYEAYPRDISHDAELAANVGVDIIFAPEVSEMYPKAYHTFVEVEQITEKLCGAFRPGHFRGVTTVVTKLFNILQPTRAYFGQKDAQQGFVIKRMVLDLNMPIDVIIMPIVREKDGLALSSRNVFLKEDERQQALVLSEALNKVEELVAAGEKNIATILNVMREIITKAPLVIIDYIEIFNGDTFESIDTLAGKLLIVVAVKFPSARLIDNIILEVE